MKSLVILMMMVSGIFVVMPGQGLAQDQGSTRRDHGDVIAVIYDQTISVRETDEMSGMIFGALLERYAQENNLEPTADDVDEYLRNSHRRSRDMLEREMEKLQESLDSEEMDERDKENIEASLEELGTALEAIRESGESFRDEDSPEAREYREYARQVLTVRNVNISLYERYGGRVAFQQAGPEPVDAYRMFLKEQQEQGSFQILDEAHEARFWEYFKEETHIFYDEDEGRRLIMTSWWRLDALFE